MCGGLNNQNMVFGFLVLVAGLVLPILPVQFVIDLKPGVLDDDFYHLNK